MKLPNIFKLILAVALCELAGVIGSVFTFSAIAGWYAGLAKPAIAPPNWVFGPVWTILFALMGISLFLVWSSYAKVSEEQEKKRIKIALILFGCQLLLNILWSVIFF